jgi:hypothetical protein
MPTLAALLTAACTIGLAGAAVGTGTHAAIGGPYAAGPRGHDCRAERTDARACFDDARAVHQRISSRRKGCP